MNTSAMSNTNADVAGEDIDQYDSLQGQPHETIRLLYLHSGVKDSPIVCSLSTTQQSKAAKYAAVSCVGNSLQGSHYSRQRETASHQP